jgi:hypothetical protein
MTDWSTWKTNVGDRLVTLRVCNEDFATKAVSYLWGCLHEFPDELRQFEEIISNQGQRSHGCVRMPKKSATGDIKVK